MDSDYDKYDNPYDFDFGKIYSVYKEMERGGRTLHVFSETHWTIFYATVLTC